MRFVLVVPALLAFASAARAAPEPIGVGRTLFPSLHVLQSGDDTREAADFDLDGKSDVAVATLEFSGTDTITLVVDYVGRQSNGSIGTKAVVSLPRGPTPGPVSLAVVPAQPPLAPSLVHVADGVATVISGWPPRQSRSFRVVQYTKHATVADLDADGRLELLVSNGESFNVYDFATGALAWTRTAYGIFTVVQADTDPALEIIVQNFLGLTEIDGATRFVDWRFDEEAYYTDTPARLVSANLDSDPSLELIAPQGQTANTYSFFSESPRSRIAIADFGMHPDSAVAADVVPGAPDELVTVGTDANFRVVVRVNSLFPPTVISERELPYYGTVGQILAADVTGNSLPEVAYSAGIGLWVDSTAPNANITKLDMEYGPFATRAPADIDGDGDLDWLIVGTGGYYATSGRIKIVDRTSGQVVLATVGPPYGASDVLPMQLDGDAALELVVSRSSSGGAATLEILDGASGAYQNQFGVLDLKPLTLYATNVDGDSVPDVVTYGRAGNGFDGPWWLAAYSGASKAELWRTAVSGSTSSGASLRLGNVDADARPEALLAIGGQCSAVDVQTRQVQWNFACNGNSVDVIDRGGVRELVVLRDEGFVDYYSLPALTLQRTRDYGDGVLAVAGIAGNAQRILVAADGRLRLTNFDGMVVAESDYLGEGIGFLGRIDAEVAGQSVTARVSGDTGAYELTTSTFAERFGGGFE